MNIYDLISERLVVLCEQKYKYLCDLVVCLRLNEYEVHVFASIQMNKGEIWYEFDNDFYEGEIEVEIVGFTALENVHIEVPIKEKIYVER